MKKEICKHPPERYHTCAYDGTLCISCCKCGKILKRRDITCAGDSLLKDALWRRIKKENLSRTIYRNDKISEADIKKGGVT